ncbi:hypothetical protein AV530_003944 [Patagioenas fasciata monilis]|uniref:Uncharacterized protein n=1 Tax=Patagioenas fasciata monilis TaxID=372326 RepID=A0A1V4KZI3_PATFA|nr:hypothetical protein AV530_003944 [Patagioenas fasciata monilis]
MVEGVLSMGAVPGLGHPKCCLDLTLESTSMHEAKPGQVEHRADWSEQGRAGSAGGHVDVPVAGQESKGGGGGEMMERSWNGQQDGHWQIPIASSRDLGKSREGRNIPLSTGPDTKANSRIYNAAVLPGPAGHTQLPRQWEGAVRGKETDPRSIQSSRSRRRPNQDPTKDIP